MRTPDLSSASLPAQAASAPVTILAPRPAAERQLADRHWRQVQVVTGVGLLAWLAVSVGVAWWAEPLNGHRIVGMPAGFWWASQGAIGAFLLIIVAYAWVMGVLERRHRAALAALRAAALASGTAPAVVIRSA